MLLIRRHGVLLAFCLFLFPLALVTFNTLAEDAFITYRYVEQCAAGHGLVYNVGERVEGFSNPLWVALLVPLKLCGVAPSLAARLLAIAFHATLTFAAGLAARRLQQRPLAAWLPLAIGLQPFLFHHLSQGLETSSYAALLGLALFAVAQEQWTLAGVLLGGVVASRPEGLGFAISLAPAALWPNGESRQRFRTLVIPLAVFVVLLLARIAYYGSWVPNTVIAKRPNPDGWKEILSLLVSWWALPLVGIVGALLSVRPLETRRLALGSVCLIAAGFAFQLKIGRLASSGFRYLVPVLVPSLVGTWLLLHTAARACGSAPTRRAVHAIAALLLLFSLWPPFRFNARYMVGLEGEDPQFRLPVRLAHFLRHPDIPAALNRYLADPPYINADAGKWIRDVLASDHPHLTLAADQMGMIGYFAPHDIPIIDLIGLMDREIASHGLNMEYLEHRSPDFLVIDSWRQHPMVKPSADALPVVDSLRRLVESPDWKARYAIWYKLAPRTRYYGTQYVVWGPVTGAPSEPIVVPIGLDDAGFEAAWPVTRYEDIPPPPGLAG